MHFLRNSRGVQRFVGFFFLMLIGWVDKLQSRGAHGSELGSIEGLFLTLGLCDHASLGYTTVLCHQAHHGPHYSDTPTLGLLCWWRLEVSHSTLVESVVQNLMITNPKSPNLSWRNRGGRWENSYLNQIWPHQDIRCQRLPTLLSISGCMLKGEACLWSLLHWIYPLAKNSILVYSKEGEISPFWLANEESIFFKFMAKCRDIHLAHR